MSHKQIYWCCQLIGWGGIVVIETINYTFFILGVFNARFFWSFVILATAGLLTTHLLRYILHRKQFFKQSRRSIWLMALLFTILLALVISTVNFIPELMLNPRLFLSRVRFIDIAGTAMNWMRYTCVWVILYFMYKILQQNNAIREEKMALENLSKTTELELLKTQLNPHFLFNALNSIKALVTINPEQSREAIVKLSELLRFTLQYGKERLITLNDEIIEVKKYLSLEQLRFGNRLEVRCNIEENTLSQTIPPALILTLAENAVKHGVTMREENCLVQISSFIRGKSLLVQVSNPGHYQPKDTTGIGLKHINKRLEEIYHHQAVFSVMQVDSDVVATIQIPLA
jgi:two-component system, LytTR family, sensor kinase